MIWSEEVVGEYRSGFRSAAFLAAWSASALAITVFC
jgi:hypothetical protein